MFNKVLVFVFASIIATCLSQSQGGHKGGESYASLSLSHDASHGHGHHYVDYHAHPKYQFKYGIADGHTHDHHEQHEERDGDTVHGEYSLHEADGTIRVVKYTADKENGFNAEVIRKGHAQHPAVHPRPPFVVFGHHGGHH